jgi:hypothetical protein
MGVVIIELNNSWKWVWLSYNFAIHAICPLEFTVYKCNELQVFVATQKLSYMASCKTFFFSS